MCPLSRDGVPAGSARHWSGGVTPVGNRVTEELCSLQVNSVPDGKQVWLTSASTPLCDKITGTSSQ